jgi:hypothetical protein
MTVFETVVNVPGITTRGLHDRIWTARILVFLELIPISEQLTSMARSSSASISIESLTSAMLLAYARYLPVLRLTRCLSW